MTDIEDSSFCKYLIQLQSTIKAKRHSISNYTKPKPRSVNVIWITSKIRDVRDTVCKHTPVCTTCFLFWVEHTQNSASAQNNLSTVKVGNSIPFSANLFRKRIVLKLVESCFLLISPDTTFFVVGWTGLSDCFFGLSLNLYC